MNRALLAALAAPAIVLAAPVAAQSDDLQRVTQHLRAVESMTAAFSQTDRQGRVLTGQLTLKQPGRIRFQYEPTVPLLIVADGRALTLIDYQVRQVQQWPIGESPLQVLLDRNADLTRYIRLVPSGDARLVTVEARDPRRPQFGVITLAFARDAAGPGGLKLQGWVALDSQNNRTRITLSDQRYNVPVAANAFQWRDPRQRGRN